MSKRKPLPPRSLLAPAAALPVVQKPSASRTTISLSVAVVDRLRAAAHAEGFGVAATVEDLITRHVDALEDAKGEPYPRRPGRRRG